MPGFKILQRLQLEDNYAHLVVDPVSRETLVIDTPDGKTLLDWLSKENLKPLAILNTHHHWDHTGGNEALLGAFPKLKVFGHVSDLKRIPGITDGLEHGQCVSLGPFQFETLFNPGHTLGAVSYYFSNTQAVFTGDTLFCGGCGRMFEGNPAMMQNSLGNVLGSLPDATRVYCGHEYTEKNLEFAVEIEPMNHAAVERLEKTRELRARGHSAVPSTLQLEKQTNPFMRVGEKALQKWAGAEDPAEVFARLRAAKDRF